MPLLFCTLYWPVIYQLCSVFGIVLMFLQISLQRMPRVFFIGAGGSPTYLTLLRINFYEDYKTYKRSNA